MTISFLNQQICYHNGMEHDEHREQSLLISWFRIQYPKFYWYLWAIPNGGQRHFGTAMKLKAEGLLAGVSDLFLMIPVGEKHGMFIEMKSKRGVISDKQKIFLEKAKEMNYESIVCYSFEEGQEAIKKYLQGIEI